MALRRGFDSIWAIIGLSRPPSGTWSLVFRPLTSLRCGTMGSDDWIAEPFTSEVSDNRDNAPPIVAI